LKKEPGFLYQEIKICDDCFLKVSKTSEYVQDPHGIARAYARFTPKGTGDLRPDLLKQRRTVKIHKKIISLRIEYKVEVGSYKQTA